MVRGSWFQRSAFGVKVVLAADEWGERRSYDGCGFRGGLERRSWFVVRGSNVLRSAVKVVLAADLWDERRSYDGCGFRGGAGKAFVVRGSSVLGSAVKVVLAADLIISAWRRCWLRFLRAAPGLALELSGIPRGRPSLVPGPCGE